MLFSSTEISDPLVILQVDVKRVSMLRRFAQNPLCASLKKERLMMSTRVHHWWRKWVGGTSWPKSRWILLSFFFFFAELCCSWFPHLTGLHYSTPAVFVNNKETSRDINKLLWIRELRWLNLAVQVLKHRISMYLDNGMEKEHLWATLWLHSRQRCSSVQPQFNLLVKFYFSSQKEKKKSFSRHENRNVILEI